MTKFPWQDILALAAVALAGGYLVRRFWSTFVRRGYAGCGMCPTCPSTSGNGAPDSAEGTPSGDGQLVSLDALVRTVPARQTEVTPDSVKP